MGGWVGGWVGGLTSSWFLLGEALEAGVGVGVQEVVDYLGGWVGGWVDCIVLLFLFLFF